MAISNDIKAEYEKRKAVKEQPQTGSRDSAQNYNSIAAGYQQRVNGTYKPVEQPSSQPTYTKLPEINFKYQQRQERQEKASENAKKAWWEVLGLAAQDASAAATGQQRTLTAEEGRQRATAGANLAAAIKENREANKVIEWDGREELLKEYRRLDEIDNPKARQEAAAIREQLRQGDIKAGNLDTDGDMAYNVGDWSSNVVPGAVKNVGSAVYNAALTAGDLYAKGEAMKGPTEQEIITEYLTGQEIGSTAKMRQESYNSDSYRNFMNERYAEADKLAASAQRNLQIAKENQAPIVKAGTDVAENMLEMGFDGGVAMLTGGSALIPMAARVFGSSAMEARQAGASLEQQALYGLSSAALEVATEKLGDGLGGLYGKGFTRNATEHMIQRLASTDPGRTFLRFISGLNSEGMEEVISGIFEPALKSIYNGKTPWQNYSEFEWGDLLYNYALGAAAAIFGGASNIVNGGNAYANAQLRAADAAQAQTDSNFGWMLPDSVKEQAQDEQFDRMFISGTPNTPTRSAAPAQKPEMKEAKTPAQRRVEAIINAAATKDQLIQSLQFFQSEPALDAAFEELTGSDVDAYLAEASQEPAGGVVPHGDNPAPATPENAQQQAPGEFNSVNEAGESSEQVTQPAAPVEMAEPVVQQETKQPVKQKPIGKKTAQQIAVDAMLGDLVKERDMDRGGIDVSADDFVDDDSFDVEKAFPQSAKEAKADSKEVIDKLRKAIPALKGAQPVRAIAGTEFTKGSVNLVEQVAEFFRSLGNKVTRAGLGDVVIDKRSVKSDIAHGIGRAKAASFIAVPDVIAKGQIIDKQTNWKGRGYDSYVIAAPVTYNGKRSYVTAVVLQDKNNRFYLHEIISADGSMIYKTNDAPADVKTGVTEEVGVTGEAGTSDTSVAEAPKAVKPAFSNNNEMQRREDLNRQSEAEQRQQPRPKKPEPESSAEFIQQNRLRKSDFENREAERSGVEAQFKAEEAQAREEIEHDEAYERAQTEAQQLADAKKAYGEENQAKLADLAKKARALVGNSRLNTSGQRGYTNEKGELVGHVKGDVTESFSYNEGGKDIESFAHVLGEFAAGRQTFSQLAEAYDKLGSYSEQKKGSYFYDKIFAEQFERLRDALENGDVRTKDGALDPKFVRSVEDLTKRVVHRFEYMQKMLKFRSHLAEVYGEGKPFRTKAGALAKALEAAHRFQLRPSTAFKMLSGYDKANGSAWYELADMARDATKNYINTFQNAQDYLRELTERKDWEDFSTGKTTVKNVIPGLNYDGDRLSANAAVSFLKMLETDGAYDHIIRNGIVEMARTEKELYGGQNNNGFGDVTGYSQTFDPISKETRAMLDKAETREEREDARAKATAELNAIKAALHAEVEACPAAKAFYDASFAPLNFLKKALNKTSRKVWGTDAAVQDKFYWPLEAGGEREGNELLNDHSFGLDQYRNVQARTGDRGGLKVRPATDVMQGYIRSASHWAAYQELSDMLEILSKDFRDTSSITQLLNDNAGKAWSKWLENYEADLNENRGKDKGYAGKIIGSLRSNLAQSSLLLNAGVALKQAPSGLDFMTVLDADIVAKRFATGFFRSARSYRNNPLIQTMEAYTKMLKNRQAGYNTVETGEATETGRKGFVNKLVDKLPSWMTNWITKTDFRTVANGLLACEDQVKRNIKNGVDGYKNLKEGSDAYYQAIADLFENAVMDTQPIYNKEYRADALRTGNEVLRILNMFRTQQTQNYNNLVETIGEYNAAKLSGDEAATKAARNRMGRTIAGQVSSAFVFAMLDAAAKMLMHKKKQYEDEDGNLSASIISQKVGWNFANSLASTSWLASKISPFVINQMTKLANKATDGKVAKSDFYSGSLDGTLALVDDFASALDSFTTKPSLKTGKALVLNLASLTGMPLKNGYNIVNAAIMHFYLDPSGKNVNNEDDIISYLDNYNKLSDESKAKQSVLRAISVNGKGNSEGADTIMATLNLDDDDIAKAAKQQLKDSFIAGDIDSMTYRNMLEKYFSMSRTEAWDLWKDVNESKKFADTKARVFGSEEESKAFDKTMSELTTTTDPTGKERFTEISLLGLNEEDTDTFVKKYMTETFSKNYDALRSIKIKPNDAARIVSSIDTNESGSLSQDEVYDYLLMYPSSKKAVNALWKASEWKTSLDKYAEDYAKQPVNILASFGMSKTEAERVAKQLNYDGKNSVTQKDFFNYLKKHPDQEEALKAVFAVKWPKSNYESKKRKYS